MPVKKVTELNAVVVVILAYGLWVTTRPVQELISYNQYLQECEALIRVLVKLGIHVNVVLSGGAKDGTKVESLTLLEYFQPTFLELRISFETETHSLTTAANLKQSYLIIDDYVNRQKWQCDQVIIFCDKPRVRKVRSLVKRIFYDVYPVEVWGFNRPDTSWKNWKIVQEMEIWMMKLSKKFYEKRVEMVRRY